jgi:DNA-directed RNA polymerase specialized sigma24 family protein
MTTAARSDAAAGFEAHRRHLMGLAYRMLGSLAEAEDAVQEAYLRWHAVERDAIDNPRACLSSVVTRLCLDQLNRRAPAARAMSGRGCPSRCSTKPRWPRRAPATMRTTSRSR